MKSITLEKYGKSFPFFAFAGIATVLFLAAPQNYSLGFSAVCLGFFVLIFAACLVLIKENSIFNFVSLFSCAYCLVYFIYPVFVLPVNKTRWFMFYYEFSETTVCKTTALALLGYACFTAGYAVRSTNRPPKPQKKPPLCRGSIAPDGRILLLLAGLTLLECYKIFALGFTNYGAEKPRCPEYGSMSRCCSTVRSWPV